VYFIGVPFSIPNSTLELDAKMSLERVRIQSLPQEISEPAGFSP